MAPANLIKHILKDIKVELKDEFDKNFERKAFFNEKWARRKSDDGKGSLMMRSGNLRRSVKIRNTATGLVVSSGVVYATIHNEGGEIILVSSL